MSLHSDQELKTTFVHFHSCFPLQTKARSLTKLPPAKTTSEGVIKEHCNFPKWSHCGWERLMGKLGAVGAGDATALSQHHADAEQSVIGAK